MPSAHQEALAMDVGGDQTPEEARRAPEDDMREGDLGDGLGRKPGGLYDPGQGKGDSAEPLSHSGLLRRAGANGSVAFSWKSCRALYASFHRQLDGERRPPSRRVSGSESLADLSCEELRQRLQEVSEEVELMRCELEVTQQHLEGKHEALKILLSRAMFDKATTHTKTLLQKTEERNKALEKEVNALQWEITFNQVQFKNLERTWREKHERLCCENKALSNSLEDKLREVQELTSENSSLSQQCQELVSMLSVPEKKAFQHSLPPHSNRDRGGAVLELAVLGACHCSANARAQSPCPCARTAAASRKQVLQLKQELELQRRRREEALMMADAFRIAFEQQLKRKSDHVMRLTEADGHLRKDTPPKRREACRGPTAYEAAAVKGSVSMAQKLRGMLQNCGEVKISEDPAEMLHNLLDLLNDKEEALAHQRKVSYMLARHSEDLERRLHQLKGQDCEDRGRETGLEGQDCAGSCSPIQKPSKTDESPPTASDSLVPEPFETEGSTVEDSDTQTQCPTMGKSSRETLVVAGSGRESSGSVQVFEDQEQHTAVVEGQRSEPG